MVDWPGLLKWSLKHSDGSGSSNFKPMDEETKNWLTEAFEHYTVDEGKIIKELTSVLSGDEQGSNPEELAIKLSAMDRLEDIIENMEASRILVATGGLGPLVKTMLGSSYQELRLRSTKIFSSSVQNNPKVQAAALELEALDGLLFASRVETEIQLRESYITALSALVRGELLTTRLDFIAKEGMKLISELLSDPPTLRIHKKILLLLSDLLYHESVEPQANFASDYASYGLQGLLEREHTDPDVQELSRNCLNVRVNS